MFKHFR